MQKAFPVKKDMDGGKVDRYISEVTVRHELTELELCLDKLKDGSNGKKNQQKYADCKTPISFLHGLPTACR
jgi:hypothetical protein